MDLLRRYQKPGGFLQLVQLIETCSPAKQTKLLSSIEKESNRWAEEVRKKTLSIERIFSWDEQTLAEILAHLPELTIAVAIQGISPENSEKAFKFFSHARKRRIDELIGSKNPTQIETSSAYIKIIAEVREMINQGRIQLATVDPELMIEDQIEEKLNEQTIKADEDISPTPTVDPPISPVDPAKSSEYKRNEYKLNMEVTKLRQENKQLKQQIQVLTKELNLARSIVAQIKKVVA